REAAGAHHVAAMREAEKWIAVSAERDELRADLAKTLLQTGDLKIALDVERARADNLMRERNDALMRLGSITEHLARLAEARDHADGEPETEFDRGYDQAGDDIAATIRANEPNAHIILSRLLAEAR